MTTTSMTTQEMNTFLEYQKSNLRVQRDELKAIKDQEEAKLKQIEIGESIVSMLEGIVANDSGTIDGVEEEKLEEDVRERDSGDSISALEQIAYYSSDEDVVQQVQQKSAEPLPIKDDQGEVLWQNYTGEDLMVVRMGIKHNLEETDVDIADYSSDEDSYYYSSDEDSDVEDERISLDGDEAIRQIERIIEELKIEKKDGDEWTELEIDITKCKTSQYWDRVFCVLEKITHKRAQKGLLTTPVHFPPEKAREFGLVEKYGRSNSTRYQYLTLGKPVEEVKDLIIKLRDFALTIRN